MPQPIYIVADNVVSPLGTTSKANFEQVVAGKSALRQVVIQGAKPLEICGSIINSGSINPIDGAYTRFETLLITSIAQALKEANIDVASPKTAFVFSTTKGNIDMLREGFYPTVDPMRIYLAEMAKAVCKYFGHPNTPLVISNACISGVSAIITGARLLRSGKYHHVIACGGDIINDFTASGFQSFKALSNEPCRPFDNLRDGLNLGEAFGTVILSALPRPNAVKVLGGATSNDANHISGPSRTGSGLKIAITAALQQSELHPQDVDTISAHGTATLYNDEMEAIAFDDLGLGKSAINSLKGYYGHTLGGAGLVESIISAWALKEQVHIATANFHQLGVTRAINVISKTQTAHNTTCLKTASGFGGCNAAIILQLS